MFSFVFIFLMFKKPCVKCRFISTYCHRYKIKIITVIWTKNAFRKAIDGDDDGKKPREIQSEQRTYLFFITSKHWTKITIQLNKLRAARTLFNIQTWTETFYLKYIFLFLFSVFCSLNFMRFSMLLLQFFNIDSRYEKK